MAPWENLSVKEKEEALMEAMRPRIMSFAEEMDRKIKTYMNPSTPPSGSEGSHQSEER